MQFLGTVELLGLDEALAATLQSATRQAIEQTLEILRAEEAEQFATQGASFGQPWPPRKRPAPWPLLIKSGRLLGSLTDQGNPEHVEQILAGPGSQVTGLFGTTVPYAKFHHLGTRALPRRILLPATLEAS